ncbi:YueI family protein [Bacillus sp. FJAT-44742]|uniref:YueI family protein n=1 Tax=Bacillus sp. FJAT-44742 TaxID=2014005 RepID=UPI0012FEFBF9|nr:YueI family protein [Bacillus sp. FJAT-44742]
MSSRDVNDYIQEGIHGSRRVNPDEQRRFLGTFRERVLIALTKEQVMKKGTYPEVEEMIKKYPDAHLLVNGLIGHKAVSEYTRLASENGIHAQRVTDHDSNTDIGLLLASDIAVDNEEIFIEDEKSEEQETDKKPSFFQRLFGR